MCEKLCGFFVRFSFTPIRSMYWYCIFTFIYISIKYQPVNLPKCVGILSGYAKFGEQIISKLWWRYVETTLNHHAVLVGSSHLVSSYIVIPIQKPFRQFGSGTKPARGLIPKNSSSWRITPLSKWLVKGGLVTVPNILFLLRGLKSVAWVWYTYSNMIVMWYNRPVLNRSKYPKGSM